MNSTIIRKTVFVTHAAPQDNEFATWISAKLASSGYKVWIDKRKLMGGDNSWDEIDHVLRNEAAKQVVVFTKHIVKPGVKKELAIGDAVRTKLSDPNFMIAIRNADVEYADAPPEFLRSNILNGFPNWHDCLGPLLETLRNANIPKINSPQANVLQHLIEARENGRRFVVEREELLLSNWFAVTPPPRVRYNVFNGTQEQTKAWLSACNIPYVGSGRLVGTFADPLSFSKASSFEQSFSTPYDLSFADFTNGSQPGPYTEKRPASNDIVNLLRQHFAVLASSKGLLPIEFANKEVGWFFPDNLIEKNRISFDSPDGRKIRRTVSGKFKKSRWHVCLIPKARLWPAPMYRIHANVVISEDGKTPIQGELINRRRRRLTRSWWNNVWRDRLLAAMNFLASGEGQITIHVGSELFRINAWPITATAHVSYDATDPPLPNEEDDDGNIVTSSSLDMRDDIESGEEDD